MAELEEKFLTWQLEEMYAVKNKDWMRLRSKKDS